MPQSLKTSLLLLAAAGLGRSQTVNYSEHIAPIIYDNCAKCHRPGQVGSLTLISYADVRQHGRDIAAQTQSRNMPPWKPEPGWTVYRDERRLSAAQIALIQKWVADGMPEGDPSKAPLLPQFTDGWQLGAPDLILEMPKGFSVPADGPDIYRNFVLPTKVTEDKWIRAIELKPSARSVVHHTLFFSDTTHKAQLQDGKDGQAGFPGFGSIFTVGDPLATLNGGLGAWAPGTTPAFFPEGIALPLPKDSDFLMQVHFHPNGLAQTEKTVIGLYYGPKPPREMTQLQVPAFFGIQANIDIPAGEADYKVRGQVKIPVDVDAVGVWAHAHYLAKEAKLTATLPSGEVRILLWIRRWDFNWQDQYLFQDLMPLPQGTRLDGELTYDNSDGNVRNPNTPPKRVKWGEQSTDEMGSLQLTVVPKQAVDIDALRRFNVAYVLTPVPLVGTRPLFVSSGMVDGASAQPGAVTPGKIVVLYGSRLGPQALLKAELAGDGRLATSLAGTEVLFDGVAAPLLYSSGGQLAAVAPYALDGKLGTQVQVRSFTGTSDAVAMPVTPVAPSIFSANLSGAGPAAILNQDGFTVNSLASPAGKGTVISIYATGEGQTQPGGIDGMIAAGSSLPRPRQTVQVLIDGRRAEVQYAGAAPGQVAGLFQVNALIPADAASGNVPIEIQVGNVRSQPGITVAVK